MIVSSGVGFVEIQRECVRDKERDGEREFVCAGKGGGGSGRGVGHTRI